MAARNAVSKACAGAPSRRLIHSSSQNRAAVAAPPFSSTEPEEVTLAPIFDIFDVPSRLGNLGNSSRSQPASPPSAFLSPRPRPLPSSLPPPIIFDGPARPRNPALSLNARHRSPRPFKQPSANRRHHTPSHPAILEQNEPQIQLFEGPARITRYCHNPSHQTKTPSVNIILLGLAGVGCATLFDTQMTGSITTDDMASQLH